MGFKWQRCAEVKHIHPPETFTDSAAASGVCDKVQHPEQWPMGLGGRLGLMLPPLGSAEFEATTQVEGGPAIGLSETSMQLREMNLKSLDSNTADQLHLVCLSSSSILQLEDDTEHALGRTISDDSLDYLLFRRNEKFGR